MHTNHRRRHLVLPAAATLLFVLYVLGPQLLDWGMHAFDTRAFTIAPGAAWYRSDIDPDSGTGRALRRHEEVHQQQMRDYGALRFWGYYLTERLDLGWGQPRPEEEARQAELDEWLTCRYLDYGTKPRWSTEEGGLPWLDRTVSHSDDGAGRNPLT